MNTLEAILISSILGGTALIPFVDLVTKDFGAKTTYIIALVSSIVIGGGIALLQGKLTLTDPSTILMSLGTVFITSQTIFKLYWQDSLARQKLIQRVAAPAEQAQPLAQEGIIKPPTQ